MSTTTTNYGLIKPDLNDPADITQMNRNWDIIDEELDNAHIPVTSEVPTDSNIWIDPDDSIVEETHITNTDNPHNVTHEQVGAVKMVKLWSNSTPTANFTAKTLSLPNLNEYDVVIITMCSGTNAGIVGTYLFNVGSGTHMTYGAGAYMGRRNIKITTNSIVFESGSKYETSWSDSDSYQKPFAIYGLKGVI